MLIEQIHQALLLQSDTNKKVILERFFKTGVGEYGYGDIFLGVTVHKIRAIAKTYANINLIELTQLIHSPIHEKRLCALYIMIIKYNQGDLDVKHQIFTLYLANTQWINNWDLVDSSAEYIVGAYLQDKPLDLLVELATSNCLWQKRIAIIATFRFIKLGNSQPTLQIATLLLADTHDLIHKAVGWMLREVGKRCSLVDLTNYLDNYRHKMSRTTLRYAIERFDKETRAYYMQRDS